MKHKRILAILLIVGVFAVAMAVTMPTGAASSRTLDPLWDLEAQSWDEEDFEPMVAMDWAYNICHDQTIDTTCTETCNGTDGHPYDPWEEVRVDYALEADANGHECDGVEKYGNFVLDEEAGTGDIAWDCGGEYEDCKLEVSAELPDEDATVYVDVKGCPSNFTVSAASIYTQPGAFKVWWVDWVRYPPTPPGMEYGHEH